MIPNCGNRFPDKIMLQQKATRIMLMQKISLRVRELISGLSRDASASAAVEFAVIVPVMMTLLFGVVDFSAGIAVDRKVTLAARTLSDLTSQSSSVTDTDLANFTITTRAIMTPYPSGLLNSTVSELYVDNSLTAKVKWSKGSAPRALNSVVVLPASLQIAGTYLIYAEANYTYTPSVAYVMKSAITLSDVTFTRPRQSTCVLYGTSTCPT
jgi:Flp pilus assembly protein TadG